MFATVTPCDLAVAITMRLVDVRLDLPEQRDLVRGVGRAARRMALSA
jgi:hypothetical protein